jgi:uncharacterized membrane protein
MGSIPLLVTAFVLYFLIDKTDGLVRLMPFVHNRPWDFPGVGLIAMIIIFYLVGLAVSTRPGRVIMDLKSKLVNSIPLVGTVHGVAEQASSSMASQYRFSRVVFIEWPRDGMIAMGFVTGRAVSPMTGESLVVVYVPTVPNPTSGNMALIIEDDVLETDITLEDAMRMVFSAGIVLPDSMAFARVPRERGLHEFLDRFDASSD